MANFSMLCRLLKVNCRKQVVIGIILLFPAFYSCETQQTQKIDPYSYNLGIIGGFSELVDVGVKKLALSEALPPSEMDALQPEAEKVAERNHVQLYRERELIVTLLFPADVATGKDVLLIYTGNTKDEYLALKADQKALQDAGKYDVQAQTEISRRFGRMLSYPEAKIEEMIAENRSASN